MDAYLRPIEGLRRLDEQGEHALVQLSQPTCPERCRRVNKFPAFVRHVVQRLKILCPVMGRKRIAEVLSRAGLQLAATTVERFLKSSSKTNPVDPVNPVKNSKHKVVAARHPNHVWHVDLTAVPTSAGFWTSWLPFALPQVWPFCWWVAVVIDHFSRRVMGFAVFKRPPSSVQIRHFLGMAMKRDKANPRHIISDKGPQFNCKGYRRWCKRRKIQYRYGAVGKYGSIAIIERFIRSMKDESLRRILVPLQLNDMRQEIGVYATWYNEYRPHQSLNGRTPKDLYDGNDPPATLDIPNSELPKLELHVSYFAGWKHLPVIELQKAA